MKKLMLVGVLCLAGFMLAPLASANALTGTCVLHGTAKFTPNLTKNLEKGVEYSFASDQKGGGSSCVEPPSSAKKSAAAHVAGKGELACTHAKGGLVTLAGETEAPGIGGLSIEGGAEISFKLQFVAAGGNVALVVTSNGGTATGNATFLKSENEKPGSCVGTAGVGELEFEAAVAGTIS